MADYGPPQLHASRKRRTPGGGKESLVNSLMATRGFSPAQSGLADANPYRPVAYSGPRAPSVGGGYGNNTSRDSYAGYSAGASMFGGSNFYGAPQYGVDNPAAPVWMPFSEPIIQGPTYIGSTPVSGNGSTYLYRPVPR